MSRNTSRYGRDTYETKPLTPYDFLVPAVSKPSDGYLTDVNYEDKWAKGIKFPTGGLSALDIMASSWRV